MEIVIPIVAAVLGLAVGAGGIFAYNKHNENGGKDKADDLVRKAKKEASEIVLNARKEATAIAEKNQAEENERRKKRRYPNSAPPSCKGTIRSKIG